jgi:PPP family 3-phenylpropionic acid transporter
MAAYGYFNIFFREAGLDSFQIGLVNSIPRVFALLLLPIWGFLTDYFQENKKVLAITITGSFLTVIAFPFAASMKLLMVLMFSYTLFQNPIIPLSDSLLLDHLGDRAYLYGKYRLWGSAGYMTFVSLIGLFLEKTEPANLFYIYAVVLLLTLILLKFLPQGERKIKVIATSDFKKIFQKKSLLFFLCFVFILQSSMNANYGYFPLYIVDHGGGEFLLGIALTIASASELAAFFFSDKIINSNKFSRLTLLISFAFTCRWLLLAFFPHRIIILLAQALHSLTFGLFFAVGVNYVNKISGEKFRATGQNIYAAVFTGMSAIFGNLIGGKLYQMLGGERMYFLLAIATILTGLIYSFYLSLEERELKRIVEK